MIEIKSWLEELDAFYKCSLILGLTGVLIKLLTSFSSDPYGTFHLGLNKIPGEQLDCSPQTEWLNMGYWKDTDVFPDACKALALKLIKASKCKSGGRVLDVGYGSGDSLILLLTGSNVPRPISLQGLTSLSVHHRRASDRIAALGLSEKIRLYLGDAVYHPGASEHPLDPESSDVQFNTILALDCAYHFNTRNTFLGQCRRNLAPGGRVALADIVCAQAWPLLSIRSRLLLSTVRIMPRANLVSLEEYEARLRETGYVDIETEDITDNVFPHFLAFLKSQGVAWYVFARVLELQTSSLRFVISVSIHDYQERTDPKPHTAYRIVIAARAQPWSMWRRYSEFDELHQDLIHTTGSPPPSPLPPKHKLSIFRSHSDPEILEARRVALEAYLRAIVSARDDKWREAHAFKEFLGIPVGRNQPAKACPTSFSSHSWLDEHSDLQTRLRDVRADINRREAYSSQGDVQASHKSNVEAKKKLAGVLSRIGNLGVGLKELAQSGMSDGEVQRRTDMVARLQDDCEKLNKMTTIARMTSSRQADALAMTMDLAPASDREALLGNGANTFTRVTRVFGKPQPPQETEVTRPLDNHGLVTLQQTQIDHQDQQLDQLATILQRQRQLGTAIGSEIEYQNELLDSFSNDVDRVGARLVATDKQLRKLR